MGFPDDLQASIESLPAILYRYLERMGNLDKNLQGIIQQNEQRCEQEIEEIKQRIESGDIKPCISHIKFSDEALDEQKYCVQLADEKVALATQAYDLVDEKIRHFDQFLRKIKAIPQGVFNDRSKKSGRASESSRGDRKKKKLAVTAELQPKMILNLPVDPNEPTYCSCNQVSWGDMIACDYPDCKIEWFHFQCVGLKEQPQGK